MGGLWTIFVRIFRFGQIELTFPPRKSVESLIFSDELMKSPLSLVIPLYNKSKCMTGLASALLSVGGVYREIIIVDDASTDGSAETLNYFLRADPFLGSKVRIVKNKSNRGPTYSRKVGCDLASAPWVQLLDADDELIAAECIKIADWLPDVEPEVAAIFTSPKLRSEAKIVTLLDTMWFGLPNSSNIIVRRNLLSDVWPDCEYDWGEDIIFFFGILVKHPMRYVRGSLADYRKEYAERSTLNASLLNRWLCISGVSRTLAHQPLAIRGLIVSKFAVRTILAWIFKATVRRFI